MFVSKFKAVAAVLFAAIALVTGTGIAAEEDKEDKTERVGGVVKEVDPEKGLLTLTLADKSTRSFTVNSETVYLRFVPASRDSGGFEKIPDGLKNPVFKPGTPRVGVSVTTKMKDGKTVVVKIVVDTGAR